MNCMVSSVSKTRVDGAIRPYAITIRLLDLLNSHNFGQSSYPLMCIHWQYQGTDNCNKLPGGSLCDSLVWEILCENVWFMDRSKIIPFLVLLLKELKGLLTQDYELLLGRIHVVFALILFVCLTWWPFLLKKHSWSIKTVVPHGVITIFDILVLWLLAEILVQK